MRSHLLLFALFVSSFIQSHAQTFSLQDTAFVKGNVLRRNILFGYDSFSIRAESLGFLDSMVSFLNTNKQLQIEVGNNSDDRPSPAYSKNLTGKRAQAITDYFNFKRNREEQAYRKGIQRLQPCCCASKNRR